MIGINSVLDLIYARFYKKSYAGFQRQPFSTSRISSNVNLMLLHLLLLDKYSPRPLAIIFDLLKSENPRYDKAETSAVNIDPSEISGLNQVVFYQSWSGCIIALVI